MNILSIIMLVFSMLGVIDRIIGNRFGLGKEFEKCFNLLGVMALTMIGMIVISPLLAEFMRPFFNIFSDVFHLDPSIIPASLFANDMGGAPLSVEVAKDKTLGMYNALVVSSMMGCTISFTIPVALGMVKKDNHKELLFGILCGLITIPGGCLIAGLMCKLNFLKLLINLIPLILLSALIALALSFKPDLCIKVFKVFGSIINILIMVGLAFGIINFLSGTEIIKGIKPIEEGAFICFNASVVMSGAFPLIFAVSKILKKPMTFLGNKIGVNEASAMGFVSTIATSVTTFAAMDKMDKKGIVLNSAFAVSAAFTFAGHLAFTMAFDSGYIIAVICGKLISGILAVVVASILYKDEEADDNC